MNVVVRLFTGRSKAIESSIFPSVFRWSLFQLGLGLEPVFILPAGLTAAL
jgi:hypothetical protein